MDSGVQKLIAERNWEYRPDVFGGVEDISGALLIRERGIFLLTDAAGNVPPGNRSGFGLYSGDARHLSVYDFTLDETPPVVLLSTAGAGFSQEQVLGNHKMDTANGRTVGRCTVEVSRQRVIGKALEERLRVTNYNPFPVSVRPAYYFDADFVDIFEVRGHSRTHPGSLSRPRVEEGAIVFQYLGADGIWRTTRIEFDRRPDALTPYRADFVLELRPREAVQVVIRISVGGPALLRDEEPSIPHSQAEYTRWRNSFTTIQTDNDDFNRVIERSITDLRMLWSQDAVGRHYLAAGTPWFDALFGRDSLITSLQALPFRPEIARDCLHLLARYQGQGDDPLSCEEPGKILHELRHDELSAIGELPYRRYYGSVDSTPLYLLLAGAYYAWTGDLETLAALKLPLVAALAWVRGNVSSSSARFLTYPTDSPAGLRNQGWKDSDEGIVHADGSLCQGPIALAEVQGYHYAALNRLAPVFEALGDHHAAEKLRREAADLRKRFNRHFWLPEMGMVALALDGGGRASEARTSNAGQVLWSRILTRDRAGRLRNALFQNDMFSGWGIRTLSSESPVFNPVGYHVGTVWPHDNAIIAHGLKLYGFHDEANEIATALLDAACAFPSNRLPELFGGQPRSPNQLPVPYPVACRPQAWTAGAMLHVLTALLGLEADAPNARLLISRPRLPYWLRSVYLKGLRVGGGSADISFIREKDRTRARVESAASLHVVTS